MPKNIKETSKSNIEIFKSLLTSEDYDNILAELILYGEPISPINHYKARAIKLGKRIMAQMYMDSKYRLYKESLVKLVTDYANNNKIIIPYSNPVAVEAIFYMGTRRRKDLANAGKLEWDAFNDIIWKDDSQILKLTTEKRYDRNLPRTEIRIFKYNSKHWPVDT